MPAFRFDPPTIPDWLTARPYAHRGLHDRAAGRIENTDAAARAAISLNYAIECDVQISADGEAMVFHDDDLDRLTVATGPVKARDAATLRTLELRDSTDRISTLADFCTLIAGRVPLVVEIKSRFDGDLRLAERCAAIVAPLRAPIALKSFDPKIIAHLQAGRTQLGLADTPLGIVSETQFDDAEWRFLSAAEKHAMANLLHWPDTRPDFLSWHVNDLPDGPPFLARSALGRPLMTWTVRTDEQLARARTWASQPVFEGTIRP